MPLQHQLLHQLLQQAVALQLLYRDSAVRANVDQLALPGVLDPTESQAWMDSQENQENVDHRLRQLQNFWRTKPNSAHAKLHRATMVDLDLKATTAHRERVVHLVLMANLATKALEVHPDPLDPVANQVEKDHPEKTEKSLERPRDRQALRVLQENKDRPARLANQEVPERMAAPDPKVLRATKEQQVALARLAAQVAQEKEANQAILAAANTAHLLVWLQVIKHYFRKRLVTTSNCKEHKLRSSAY